ncbi:glucose-6-phosphate 1-dehydrogenase [Drosophila subobscura]|uniref:glucose-6-phosphate 1-dehydrogenase n=1 Tax=Drosophila subobscura TaxID=7241 RepID=UPI00155A1B15|nr:glucose-6-phosphate 1-dehydrogenase [Drosophila subobscura]
MQPIDPNNETAHSFVVLGASGRLAMQKVFPALWALYRDNRLPQGTRIFTFSRTKLHTRTYRLTCAPYMNLDPQRDPQKFNSFWLTVHCVQGQYDQAEDYAALTEAMIRQETKHNQIYANRIFYLALPPVVFDHATTNLSRKCKSLTGCTRIVVEKPFARNDLTYRPYQTALCQTFKESQIYMIDHFLSKQISQNLFGLRFANLLWSGTLNNRHVAAVMITVKCEKPVKARAEYFNFFGIIRDVMTNHMMQLLALVSMDKPYSNTIDDLRNERLKLFKEVTTANMGDVILGQYRNNRMESDPDKVGYTEHSYIPKDSMTPTFAMVVLHINNRRWSGVPFILRAGKAMNDTKTEVRIQYKSAECDEGKNEELEIRNELVLRVAPFEEIFMRLLLKQPGEELCLKETALNLRVDERNTKYMPNYNSLILDLFKGNQSMFMRTDEQCEIWRIFSPILQSIDLDRPKPLPYDFGSRGPVLAYRKAERVGFVFFASDEWRENKETLDYTVKSSRILSGPHHALKPERAQVKLKSSEI